ncbi:MAG: hypothetical protein U1F87_18990 [Kiritimatiellia bacterium]
MNACFTTKITKSIDEGGGWKARLDLCEKQIVREFGRSAESWFALEILEDGYSIDCFLARIAPFVVFVLFVVKTNFRPMPASRGRNLHKADMRPRRAARRDLA